MASYQQLIQARQMLAQGGVLAYPTEAVFGYGCDPFNEVAVTRLLAIKSRGVNKGLILIAADMAQLDGLLQALPEASHCQLAATWPGAVTWLIPDPEGWAPPWIRGTYSSVAVRIPAHPLARRLCQLWGGPLVSTSANRSGEPPCSGELALRHRLQQQSPMRRPDLILSGKTAGFAKPSEIRDLITGQVIRQA